MKCWHCEELARAACVFCGRFVCKDHVKPMSTFIAMFLGGNESPKGLAVANVLRGVLRPMQCKLFAKACTPLNPLGPCMVSSEGACAAAFKYERREALSTKC